MKVGMKDDRRRDECDKEVSVKRNKYKEKNTDSETSFQEDEWEKKGFKEV